MNITKKMNWIFLLSVVGLTLGVFTLFNFFEYVNKLEALDIIINILVYGALIAANGLLLYFTLKKQSSDLKTYVLPLSFAIGAVVVSSLYTAINYKNNTAPYLMFGLSIAILIFFVLGISKKIDENLILFILFVALTGISSVSMFNSFENMWLFITFLSLSILTVTEIKKENN